jgi:flagellar biosynthesis chaperone FliJ
MPLRRPRNAGVTDAQVALDEAVARREEVAEQIAALHGKQHQLAEDADAYEAWGVEISRLQSEHRRLELVVARREEELEEARRQATDAEWQRAGRELEKAYGPAGQRARPSPRLWRR